MSYTDYSSSPGVMGNAGAISPQRYGVVQALMDVRNPPPGAAVPGPAPQFAGMPPQPAAPGLAGGAPGMGMPGGGAGMAPPMGTPGQMPGGLAPGAAPTVGGLYGQTPAPTQQPVTGRPAY
jgi:hypothetical protein